MENPTVPNQTSEPVVALVPVSKPKFPAMYLVLSLLSLALLASTAFLYYQNMQLKNMLISYQDLASPIPATYSSPAPSISTVNNWKLVSNKFWSFKIPSNLNSIKCKSEDLIFVGLSTGLNDLFYNDQVIECNFGMTSDLFNVFRGLHNSQNDIIIPTNTDPKFDPVISEVSQIEVDSKKAILQKETISSGQGTGTRYKIYIDNPQYTDVITFNDVSQKELMNQILSTFKFIN